MESKITKAANAARAIILRYQRNIREYHYALWDALHMMLSHTSPRLNETTNRWECRYCHESARSAEAISHSITCAYARGKQVLLYPHPSATESRIAALEAKLSTAREALKPFSRFCGWLELAVEQGEVEPIPDHVSIVQLSVCGGSDYVWMADLRKAQKALVALEVEE